MTDASLTSEPEKLLPCPFCKGSPKMANGPSRRSDGTGWLRRVICLDCEALGPQEHDDEEAAAMWNRRLSSPVSGTDGRERLALEAIKAVTATAKDAVRGLSRIMAITGSAGVDAPYSELMAKPDVWLIVNSPRTEWRHLFERPEGCTIPPEGWTCSRTPGHDGPCAASPSTPIPVIAEAGEREATKWRERWYGSEPQRGSAIVDERGNLIAYFGGDETTHKATTAAVAAHNAALSTPATLDNTAVEGQS